MLFGKVRYKVVPVADHFGIYDDELQVVKVTGSEKDTLEGICEQLNAEMGRSSVRNFLSRGIFKKMVRKPKK